MLDPDEFPYVMQAFEIIFEGTDQEQIIPVSIATQYKQREEVLCEVKIWQSHGKRVRVWKIQATMLENF